MNNINSALMQKISTNLASINATEVAREQATNKMLGRAAVNSGRSLADIKENQPALEKIFGGGATIQGANEQYVQRSLTDYATGAANNMQELRKIDSGKFAAMQADTIANQMTGDPKVDSMLMASSQKAVDLVTNLQYKENYAYIQEENLKAFNANISSSVDLSNIIKRKGDATSLAESQNMLRGAIQQPFDMDDDAYKQALLNNSLVLQGQGDNNLSAMIRSMNLNWTPEEVSKMDAGKVSYLAAKRKEDAIDLSIANAAIDNAVTSGIREGKPYGPEQIIADAKALDEVYGQGSTGGKLFGWLTQSITGDAKAILEQNNLEVYMGNAGGMLLSKPDADKAAIQFDTLIDTKTGEGKQYTPEQALAMKVGKWNETDINNSQVVREFTFKAANPLLQDGLINPGYLELLEGKFQQYLGTNKDKALDMLGDAPAIARFLAIQKETALTGNAKAAILKYADPKVVADAKAYSQTAQFRASVNELTTKVFEGEFNLFSKSVEPASDTSWMHDKIRATVLEQAEKGVPADQLVDASDAALYKTIEVVNGEYVNNLGKSLGARFNSIKSGEEVINTYLERHMDYFPTDTLQEDIKVRFNPSTGDTSFWLRDENGVNFAPYGTNFGVPFPTSEIARDNQAVIEEERLAQVHKELVINEHNITTRMAELKAHQTFTLTGHDKPFTKSNEELRAEAIADLQEEGTAGKLARIGSGALLELTKNWKKSVSGTKPEVEDSVIYGIVDNLASVPAEFKQTELYKAIQQLFPDTSLN